LRRRRALAQLLDQRLNLVWVVLRIPLKAGHLSGGCRASVPVHAGLV
jgi:hypothetical protein